MMQVKFESRFQLHSTVRVDLPRIPVGNNTLFVALLVMRTFALVNIQYQFYFKHLAVGNPLGRVLANILTSGYSSTEAIYIVNSIHTEFVDLAEDHRTSICVLI